VIILGIDPGTAALGYGVIERTSGRLRPIDYGCFETSADLPLPDRLLAIHGALSDLIDLHSPDLVCVERLFFSRNVQTAFAVGQARGVVLLASAARGVPVREATPNEVKVAVAGNGRAEKDQVQRMVKLVLGLDELPRPDDAADALALAVCVAHRERAVQPVAAPVQDRAAVAPIDRRHRAPVASLLRDPVPGGAMSDVRSRRAAPSRESALPA
jgi:crossover junction endodeoxyribonuclease RuvC